MRSIIIFGAVCALSLARAGTVENAIATIQNIGGEGEGSVEASSAWQELTQSDVDSMFVLLRSMEESGPLARNWLRAAVEVIFDTARKSNPESIPLEEMKTFLRDTENLPLARDLAFDLIGSVDPELASQLQPEFLNDPSPELRRGAVALLIDEGRKMAASGDTEGAADVFSRALDSARDANQIKQIAKLLREKTKRPVDLPRHFGFLMYWQVIGPFDNTDRSGFDKVYPPEQEIDLTESYTGKSGEVSWQDYFTTDEYGMVDFNQPYNPLKGVVGYAYTEFQSEQKRAAEIRLGCKNAWKVWVNGAFVFGRDEYHRGMRIDQYRLPIQLEKGKNTILVKACQDEQTQDWTKEWQFQLRVCDSTGTAILSTDRKPTPVKEPVDRRR